MSDLPPELDTVVKRMSHRVVLYCGRNPKAPFINQYSIEDILNEELKVERERVKSQISAILGLVLSGKDESLRHQGFTRWGLVERMIHRAVDDIPEINVPDA